ncbi:RNA-directed DNA polymerase [Tenacibaculum maritimum]|nr:RNA-directed DNA polymerase [Tenacibaculum maritimum]MDB0602334.1 RNA-directed DNA polymerase [Tenacibaculum maritimum]MDB0612469.1 RNA-directed DNA polymerase [Tenacibaculum maritimum]
MKRIGNLYSKIISIENLTEADKKAQKGKLKQYGVQVHNRNKQVNILELHNLLKDKTYKTSEYDIFKVYEPKEREVYRLPYFPDRITHHAIMNVLEPIFVSTFTDDTYSCIKNRGIHSLLNKLKNALKSKEETTYCLKLDIKKFYPNIDHAILKMLLRKKFKDNNLLWLLDEIIDSAKGLPIGNYLSQYFANFYLSYFDHWIKEELRIKYYFRYADDIVILHHSKQELHLTLHQIRNYLNTKLNLEVKGNYQIFPVESRGIDFVGYVFFHTHIKLRKRIKQNFARKLKNNPNTESKASYLGWLKHCNAKHLTKKLLPNEQI